MPKLKICGMRNPENIKLLLEVGLDFMGFIFYEKSPRCVDDEAWKKVVEVFDNQQDTKKVGVFVNPELEAILARSKVLPLDFIQLHGQESPAFCQEVQAQGFKVIKAFSVDSSFDFSQLKAYEKGCDYFLFDTKGKLPGGNGFQFDWSLLAEYREDVPFFLGGGINPNSVKRLLAFKHPKLFGIDGNSGFEISPGLKDIKAIQQFKTQYLTNTSIS